MKKEIITAVALSVLFNPGFAQNTFQIQSTAQLICSGNTIVILQDFNQFKNNGTFEPGNGTFIVRSTNVPTIIGVSGGNPINFFKLDIDNSTGVQLSQPLSIVDTLYFITGNFNLKNNSITFGATGGIAGETETTRLMDDPSNAGQIIITQNLAQSPSANPGNIGVEINATAAATGNTTVTRYCGVVVYNGSSAGLIQRYYKIEPSTNTGLNASAKFHYLNKELNGVDPALAVLWKSTNNGVSWSSVNPDARDVNAKWLQKNNINDFSLWTIGSINSVLPVIFTSFNTICKSGGASLQWSTGVELNSAYFIVEKSTDKITWNEMAHINAFGTASSYNFEDRFGGVAYYRLKEVDQDGHFKYSNVLQSNCEIKNISVLLYPNPAERFTNLAFHSSADFLGNICIYDVNGKLIRKITVDVYQGNNVIRMNLTDLTKGTYMITLKGKDVDISQRLVVHQ